jgi:hypothetical protein
MLPSEGSLAVFLSSISSRTVVRIVTDAAQLSPMLVLVINLRLGNQRGYSDRRYAFALPFLGLYSLQGAVLSLPAHRRRKAFRVHTAPLA